MMAPWVLQDTVLGTATEYDTRQDAMKAECGFVAIGAKHADFEIVPPGENA